MPRVSRHRLSGSQAAIAARSQNIPCTLQAMFGQGARAQRIERRYRTNAPLSSHVKIEDFGSCPVADIRCAERKRLSVTKICRGVILGQSNGFRAFKRRISFAFFTKAFAVRWKSTDYRAEVSLCWRCSQAIRRPDSRRTGPAATVIYAD